MDSAVYTANTIQNVEKTEIYREEKVKCSISEFGNAEIIKEAFMDVKEVKFEELKTSDLYVDCIYKGGTAPNNSAEVLSKLMSVGNSSGFRTRKRQDKSGKYAYVVLFTSMDQLEWPDYLDKDTGIFRYYGDNKKPGRDLLDTKQNGNKILEMVFSMLHSGTSLEDMPPFFVFKKSGDGRDMQFLGLAAPGNPKLSPDKDLVAFWRTIKDNRFQNYEAYFTILDTGEKPISRKWLDSLINDHENNLQYAPDAWKRFIKKGRNGIVALKAPTIVDIPTKYEQLQCNDEGRKCLEFIRKAYRKFPQGFEACATDIVCKMDPNFTDFVLTRPWRDGGRDAIGHYSIKSEIKVNTPLKIDCALEAKCYSLSKAVGVREMSRLISRIRYRQFGIMVTTSSVGKQAYKEVVEDGHPILIITAADIANILRINNINSTNVDQWLTDINNANRIAVYYNKLTELVKENG